MRQLITRIDDELHARLKARAAAEGRSMNAVVQELLERQLSPDDPGEELRRRAAAAGIGIFVPPRPKHVPSRDEVIASTRGAGRAVSEALEADRKRR